MNISYIEQKFKRKNQKVQKIEFLLLTQQKHGAIIQIVQRIELERRRKHAFELQ